MKSRVPGLLTLAFTAAFLMTGVAYHDVVFHPPHTVQASAASTPIAPEDFGPTLDPWIGVTAGDTVINGLWAEGKAAEVEAQRIADEAAAAKKQRRAERKQRKLEARQARQAARQAYLDSLITTTSGPLGDLVFSKTEGVDGNITTVVSNIPGRTPQAGWETSLQTIIAPSPDFVALNEVFNRPTEEMLRLAPAYGVIRGEPDPTPGGAGQSQNNVILYRTDTWTPLASGMVKVVNDDRTVYQHKNVLWDRYATWALFQRADGAVVSVISAHMPTNPGKYPQQWGHNAMSRIELYAKGMDTVRSMAAQLSAYGPVLVGGDMNSHPNQGAWTAAQKMALDGYVFTHDTGVMHFFYQGPATVVETHQFYVVSDHPALDDHARHERVEAGVSAEDKLRTAHGGLALHAQIPKIPASTADLNYSLEHADYSRTSLAVEAAHLTQSKRKCCTIVTSVKLISAIR